MVKKVSAICSAGACCTTSERVIQRVELHELNAGQFEDLFARQPPEGFFHHPVGAAVAIMIGIADERAGRSSKPKSTPHVSMPIPSAAHVLCVRNVQRVLISDHRRRMSQCRPSGRRTGPLEKRCTSVRDRRHSIKRGKDRSSAFGTQIDG